MTPEIRTTPRDASLLGVSTRHDPAKPYGQEIISLLDRVWPAVRAHAIANTGINWVVYEADHRLFAGVEAHTPDPPALGLEAKRIHLERHAAWKHVGPYRLLGQVGAELKRTVEAQGHRTTWPLIEVYGHWNNDESKLETEILMALA